MKRFEKRMACRALKTDFEVRGKTDPTQVYAQQKAIARSMGCSDLGFDLDDWKINPELHDAWEEVQRDKYGRVESERKDIDLGFQRRMERRELERRR